MNQTLKALLNKYGTETVIARILEQLKLLALSKDEEVRETVIDLIVSSGCDTEYIYTLCEYTNFATYVSEQAEVTDRPWIYETDKPNTKLCLVKK